MKVLPKELDVREDPCLHILEAVPLRVPPCVPLLVPPHDLPLHPLHLLVSKLGSVGDYLPLDR